MDELKKFFEDNETDSSSYQGESHIQRFFHFKIDNSCELDKKSMMGMSGLSTTTADDISEDEDLKNSKSFCKF